MIELLSFGAVMTEEAYEAGGRQSLVVVKGTSMRVHIMTASNKTPHFTSSIH